MWSQSPEQDDGRNFEHDTGNEEDRQRSIILRACELDVVFEAVDDGVISCRRILVTVNPYQRLFCGIDEELGRVVAT